MYRVLCIISAFFCFCSSLISQDTNSVKISSTFEQEDFEFLFLLEDILFNKIEINDPRLAGKTYKIITKEFNKFGIIKCDTFYHPNFKDLSTFNENDSVFVFKILSKTINEKAKFIFSTPTLNYHLNLDIENRKDYSLRCFSELSDTDSIPIGEPFTFFVFTPPAELEDGVNSWCILEYENTPVEEWGTKYNLSHYFVVEMLILEE